MKNSAENPNQEICSNCGQQLSGHFCSNCGQPKKINRINHQYIVREVAMVLNFNKGIFFTIKELIIRPGKCVHDFIHFDRNRLVKPIVFLIITSLVYSLIQSIVGFKDGYIAYGDGEITQTATVTIFKWIAANYGYANLIMAVFIALWVKLLFWKHQYNFYEIFILLCFIMGISMLNFALFGTLEQITSFQFLSIGSFIGFIYCAWAIGQFFDKKKWYNYLKGILSYIMGMLSFIVLSVLIGKLIDKFILMYI